MVCLSCGYLSKGIHFLCSYFRIGGASIIAHTAHQINEEIHDKEVRLISAQGEQLGIMPLAEAMAKAGDADLDLVKISPNAVPPVCKLMDYGKYRFEQTKRDKEAKKNQRIVEIKEVRMSPGIDVNDFNVKVRNAQQLPGRWQPGQGCCSLPWPGNGPYRHRQSVCWKNSPSRLRRGGDHGQGAQAGWTSHDHVPVLPAEQRDQKVKSYERSFPPCLKSRLKPTAAPRSVLT